MTRTSGLPPPSRSAPTAQPGTTTTNSPTNTPTVADQTAGWQATNRAPATSEPQSLLTAPTLASLFSSRGLSPTINLDLLKTDPSVVATTVEPPHDDPRGAMLANSFFSQLDVPTDGSTLPIVLEGSAHTYALRAEAAKRGFQTFVTGALTSPGNPVVSSTIQQQALRSLPGYAQGAETPAPLPADAPAMLVVSDFHMTSYKMMLPSADELKKRGITTVKVGLENEDLGARSVDEYIALGIPAQRALASQLKAYQNEGLKVELVGLDQPREVTATGERPWQTSLVKRLAWEQGMGGAATAALFDATPAQLPTIDAYLDQLTEKYATLGAGFAAQLQRIADAKAQAHAQAAAVPPRTDP